jgi:putative transposase
MSLEDKRGLIEPENTQFSLRWQCEILGLTRASWYYQPRPVSAWEIHLMNLIDMRFTLMPFYGVPRMTAYLKRQGEPVGDKRVRRLMRQMGLYAIYPKPKTSQPHPEHKIFPYLLRGVEVIRPNQVWAADITYIRLQHGFAYLVAIMDWFSRYVLAWRLSNNMEADFCIECLEEALSYGCPDIFNTDQGSQFTSLDFTGCLLKRDINVSMDGRGRVFDNIFVERLWRSVKYEDVYIHGYQLIPEAKTGLGKYFRLYNVDRQHESLNYLTPWEVYSGLGQLQIVPGQAK